MSSSQWKPVIGIHKESSKYQSSLEASLRAAFAIHLRSALASSLLASKLKMSSASV